MTHSEPCVVCMEDITTPYTVQCGSTIPHIICSPCELAWRMKSSPSQDGRLITCPVCRGIETDTSKRSSESLQAELRHVYAENAKLNAKKGTVSTMLNGSVRDYIWLLESVARVPHIQLNGLMDAPRAEIIPSVEISYRDRQRVEMESRVVRAVVSREARAAAQEAQEIQRQAERRERAAQRRAIREQEAAERLVAETLVAEAAEPLYRPVWCESGNILLGTCTTTRKTSRKCSFASCTKKVCSRCDKCNSH
jgi:hypothetical protein